MVYMCGNKTIAKIDEHKTKHGKIFTIALFEEVKDGRNHNTRVKKRN